MVLYVVLCMWLPQYLICAAKIIFKRPKRNMARVVIGEAATSVKCIPSEAEPCIHTAQLFSPSAFEMQLD